MLNPETNTRDFITEVQTQFPRINFFGAPALITPAMEIPEDMFGKPEVLEAAEDLTRLLRAYRDRFGIGRGLAINQVADIRQWMMTAMIIPTPEDNEQMIV